MEEGAVLYMRRTLGLIIRAHQRQVEVRQAHSRGGNVRYRFCFLGAGVLVMALGCGDGGTAPHPGGDGQRLAAQFERLADSVAEGGYSPTAEALRHAAEVVRLAGGPTSGALTIDGAARQFLAVAEQIDFPNLMCSWPADSAIAEPGDSVVPVPAPAVSAAPEPGECTVVDTSSMRTLIAWEPERMAEVVRIVGNEGGGTVQRTTPDVMVDLPATGVAGAAPGASGSGDSAVGGGTGGGYPGFMGEYLVRDVGSWWAVEGEQHNALAAVVGACTADRTTFDWAEFSCSAARFRFDFGMRVEPLRYERLTQTAARSDPAAGSAEGSHLLQMEPSTVDGVKLTVIAWRPPPLPPVPAPEPLPPDSSTVRP
jgi:hypothetical protein